MLDTIPSGMKFFITAVFILLLIGRATGAKGHRKRQLQENQDENEPPLQRRKVKGTDTPLRTAATTRPVEARRRFVGLQPQSLPDPHINETGYYNLPETFWFSPDPRDARTLAEAAHEAITQVFFSYPQNRLAMARMQAQLDRHQQAWIAGQRSRYISDDSRQGRHDPQYENWDDMEEYLQQLWRHQYESQLRLFLAMYRDCLLRLLATWLDSFGVPRRDNSDDDPSGMPFHPGPTGVSRNNDESRHV